MATYEPEDLHFLRVYKCVNHVGRNLMQMIFEWGFTLTPPETLKQYIFRKNNYTNASYKHRYDADQKKKIEEYNVHNGKHFDVTAFFRLIQDTSNNIAPSNEKVLWITQSNSQLENLLHQMKKVRNDLTHNPVSLHHASAQQMIENYKDLFLHLIEAAGIRYGKNVTSEKERLKDDINILLNHHLNDIEIQQLFRQQIHERSKIKMMTGGAHEMKEKYIKQTYLNPLTLIDGTEFRLPVINVYKKLEIRDCGRHAKNILIDSNDLLRLNASYSTVTDMDEAADIVILEGPTGSGKTTITKLLLAEWSTNPNSLIKGLLDYTILIYMECRNTKTETLENLLHSMMPTTYQTLEEDPIKTLSACSVLMIIDSLDELNENTENLFKELLELAKMKNITAICTMRPTKVKDIFAFLPQELIKVRLESRGIPEKQRGSFVEMYHSELHKQGKSSQSTKGLVEQLNRASSRLQEHLRYPINLVHLVFLWAIAPEKVKFVTCATELYSSIHDVVQIKLSAERLINNSLTKQLTDEERRKKTKKFLEALYLESMYNLTRQQYCILPKDSEAVLKKACKDNHLPHVEILSAFLVTRSLWTGLTAETEYRISHTDMQEYLAACCIFYAVKNKSLKKLKARVVNESQNGSSSISKVRRSFSNVSLDMLTNTPVTDVLNIFFTHTEISMKDYQNVLKHLTGLFVLNDKTMSKDVAKDLVELLKKSNMESGDWLNMYAEAESDKNIVKYLRDLCGDMLEGDITVRDTHLSAYAILLTPKTSTSCINRRGSDVVDSANIVKVSSLTIKLEDPPSHHPDLKDLMIHAITFPFYTELHLVYSWRKPEPGSINAILDATQKSSNLKVVRGSLSSSDLGVIASNLQKLYISICDDDHARDVLAINVDFPRLRLIYIHLKCGDVSSEALKPLTFGKIPSICLFLSDVDDSKVTWAVEISKALQQPNGKYDCLYLPNNKLTSSGFVNLVNELHQSNVKILVRIGVTSDLVDEKQDEPLEPLKEANEESRKKLRCDVLWYFSAERMEGW